MAAIAKTRDYSFDIAKGLAIYLVVLGHLVTVSAIRIPIDFIHMPVFFFISGWFFVKVFESDAADFPSQVGRKAKRLLVPFLVWSFIALVFNVTLWYVGGGMQTGSIFDYVATQAVDIFIHLRSLWFLLVLFATFCYLLVCRFIAQKMHINRYAVALVGWLVAYVFLPDNYDASFFGLYKFEWLFPLFLAGCWLKGSSVAISAKKIFVQHKIASVAGLVAVITLMYLCYDAVLFELWGVPYVFAWSSPLVAFELLGYYLLSFGGVIGILVFSGWLAKTRARKWLSELGVYSIDIYVMHMFFIKAFLLLCPAWFLQTPLCDYLVAPLFSLVVVVAIWAAAKYILDKIKPYAALMRG
ncbi:MAG: acyltransferase family protein [Raoultibacter sp.]